jgi:DNA-directed RNA polymerase subunit omega
MARVFVEKALEITGESPYDLILMASKRGREISQGSRPLSERQHKDEKSAVTALREIEEGLYTRDHFDGKIKNAEQLAKEAQEKEELDDEHQFTQSERTPE